MSPSIPGNLSYYCGGKQYTCGFYQRPKSAVQRPLSSAPSTRPKSAVRSSDCGPAPASSSSSSAAYYAAHHLPDPQQTSRAVVVRGDEVRSVRPISATYRPPAAAEPESEAPVVVTVVGSSDRSYRGTSSAHLMMAGGGSGSSNLRARPGVRPVSATLRPASAVTVPPGPVTATLRPTSAASSRPVSGLASGRNDGAGAAGVRNASGRPASAARPVSAGSNHRPASGKAAPSQLPGPINQHPATASDQGDVVDRVELSSAVESLRVNYRNVTGTSAVLKQPSLATYGTTKGIYCLPRPVSASYGVRESDPDYIHDLGMAGARTTRAASAGNARLQDVVLNEADGQPVFVGTVETGSGGLVIPRAGCRASSARASGGTGAKNTDGTAPAGVGGTTCSGTPRVGARGQHPFLFSGGASSTSATGGGRVLTTQLGDVSADQGYQTHRKQREYDRFLQLRREEDERKQKALELSGQASCSVVGTAAGTIVTDPTSGPSTQNTATSDDKSGSLASLNRPRRAAEKQMPNVAASASSSSSKAAVSEVIFTPELPGYMKGKRVKPTAAERAAERDRSNPNAARNRFVYRNDKQTELRRIGEGCRSEEEEPVLQRAGPVWAGNVLTWSSKYLRPHSGRMRITCEEDSVVRAEHHHVLGGTATPGEKTTNLVEQFLLPGGEEQMGLDPARMVPTPARNLTGTFHKRNLAFFVKNKPAIPRPYSVTRAEQKMKNAEEEAGSGREKKQELVGENCSDSAAEKYKSIHTVVPPKSAQQIRDLKHLLEADDDLTLEGDEIVYREGQESP